MSSKDFRCKRQSSGRRGSALLIVLGMLAFMIISAVAFSAYMRYARMPSSYLRRTTASRELVKGALALAIDQIDRSIGNDVAPGFHNEEGGSTTTCIKKSHDTNIWLQRVFFGANAVSAQEDTVPVLTLEGLAYIPPPLVNCVRYLSRITPTAQMHPLAFDSGRYAFCAVDVSDFLDVNKLEADHGRSSAPSRRILLTHLLESGEHGGVGSAAAWDNWMKGFRTIDPDTFEKSWSGNIMPFVSLADFNLALGNNGGVGEMKSPFCNFVGMKNTEDGDSRAFDGSNRDAADSRRISRMPFITDSLFPASATSSNAYMPREEYEDYGDCDLQKWYDLNEAKYQPFTDSVIEDPAPPLSQIVFGSQLQENSEMKWLEHVSGLGMAALYDYLDPDHVPISLAVPTTERAPMICGIKPQIGSSPKIAIQRELLPAKPNVENENENTRTVSQTLRFRLDGAKLLDGVPRLQTLVAYPFYHPADDDDTSYQLDARMTWFFSTGNMTLRTESENDVLHLTDSTREDLGESGVDANGLIHFANKKNNLEDLITRKKTTENDALETVPLVFQNGPSVISAQLAADGNELISVTYQWEQQKDRETGRFPENETVLDFLNAGKYGSLTPTAAHCGIRPLNERGELDETFKTDARVLESIRNFSAGPEAALNVAVWARIKATGSVNKFVDLVPASRRDDMNLNAVDDNYPLLSVLEQQGAAPFGTPYPLLRFDTGSGKLKFSIENLNELAVRGAAGETPLEISPSGVIVADPRYNFAPENWFKYEGSLDPNGWLSAVQNAISGTREGRDSDIFMATSDAGYLQSKYELAHIPRFTDFAQGQYQGQKRYFGDLGSPGNPNNGRIPDNFSQTAHNFFAYRTYDPVDIDKYSDPKLQDTDTWLNWKEEGTGFAISPYTDCTNVIMAAFANTPIDWKRASSNLVGSVSNVQNKAPDYAGMTASEYNKLYARNSYTSSADARMSWNFLTDLASDFMLSVRENNGDWEEAWRNMPWDFYYTSANKDKFLGMDKETSDGQLWSSDRKFLYGFWRDCFANRQQLFLVFVRAEPVMMGGGGLGQTPPQLGARAVALVWRDPSRSRWVGQGAPSSTPDYRNPTYPHQTRVLFYRQLD